MSPGPVSERTLHFHQLSDLPGTNPASVPTSARAEGMTNHSTGDNVPAAGAEFAVLESQPGVGSRELVQGSRGQSPLGARAACPDLRSAAEPVSSLAAGVELPEKTLVREK